MLLPAHMSATQKMKNNPKVYSAEKDMVVCRWLYSLLPVETNFPSRKGKRSSSSHTLLRCLQSLVSDFGSESTFQANRAIDHHVLTGPKLEDHEDFEDNAGLSLEVEILRKSHRKAFTVIVVIIWYSTVYIYIISQSCILCSSV